jgi:LDH2 family malate/lactate/ureidoglycolate dehydrogenase
MTESINTSRIAELKLRAFAAEMFTRLGVPPASAELAAQSLVDASLLGIDTHGIESLDMYVTHIRSGGLKVDAELICLPSPSGRGAGGEGDRALQVWDMQHGFGLAGARRLMAEAIRQARAVGIALIACRNANHLGACGVYGKMAADEGLIGIVSQQTMALLAPWGGKEPRIGASPFALVAPVADSFPFFFDTSMAAATRAQIKAHHRAGTPLPEGVALDDQGQPTVDPEKAWHGQILPIGRHKGVGLAMVFEILSCVLSGNRFACEIPSIVNDPRQSAGSGIFMMAIDPRTVMPDDALAATMKRYVEYQESSPARDPSNPARYPGRKEGDSWADRRVHGVPVSQQGYEHLRQIAQRLEIEGIIE